MLIHTKITQLFNFDALEKYLGETKKRNGIKDLLKYNCFNIILLEQ